MTITDFKELAEFLQALIISIGIIVGGIWAIYRYRMLKERDKAKIELLQIQKQIEERGTVKLNVEVSQLTSEELSVLVIDVKIANTGNRTELLNLVDAKVHVSSLSISEKNEINVVKTISTKLTSIGRVIKMSSISPNDEKCYPYIFKLPKGSYLFEFNAPGSQVETNRHMDGMNNSGQTEKDDIALWGARKFFQVK